MSIHAIKVWFDGDKLVTQEIPEEKLYNRAPVVWAVDGNDALPYTSRVEEQREWVGLTDEEIHNLYDQHHNQYGQSEFLNYERAIEAKLREKNGG